MLKGLKLKTKLPDKSSESSTQPSQPSRIEEENNTSSRSNKRWMKTSDGAPVEKKIVMEDEKVTEHDLIRFCEDIWESFLKGDTQNTERLFKGLKRKEQAFYENLKEETVIVNKHIAEEPDEDIFAAVEKTALKNFDPRKSSYLVTDLISETVKTKGKTNDDEIYKLYKKKAAGKNPENLYDEEYDTKEVEDENKKKSKKEKKMEEKERKREVIQNQRIQRILSDCRFCLGNNQIVEEQILSFSPTLLLILPEIKKYEKDHFYILPVDHVNSQVELDEDQYEELRNYMKCLTAMYDKKDCGIIFMENFVNIDKAPHCVIEAVATPRAIHEELPLYFKKALNELESEWSTHKKIIEIKKEKGGIRKQIPKNFPYFFIDFDTTYGYAHVIEKTKDYNRNFSHEIIGSLLKVDKSMTMFPKKMTRSELVDMKEKFLDDWSDFDWTKAL